jgi:DnaK suppressor protein
MGRILKEVDVTAVKKAAPSAKKTGPSAKKAPAKAKTTSSKTSKKATPTPKKAAIPTKTATKKTAPTAKKAAPVRARAASEKKSAPAATKRGAAKKAAPPAKAATPTVTKKKAAPAKVAAPAPAPPKRPTVGPYAKDAKFLDEQRVLLLEERGIYSGQAVDLRAEADSLALEREPGDVQFDEESGEGGTVTVDRERNLALSAQASAAVEEIDDALRKIDRKTYGGCERCHQPIPKARLRALPFARLCVACKSGGLSRR